MRKFVKFAKRVTAMTLIVAMMVSLFQSDMLRTFADAEEKTETTTTPVLDFVPEGVEPIKSETFTEYAYINSDSVVVYYDYIHDAEGKVFSSVINEKIEISQSFTYTVDGKEIVLYFYSDYDFAGTMYEAQNEGYRFIYAGNISFDLVEEPEASAQPSPEQTTVPEYTLDTVPAGAVANSTDVQGTTANINTNPVVVYKSLDNGAEGIAIEVETGTEIQLVTKYIFTVDETQLVFYRYDYTGDNEELANAAVSEISGYPFIYAGNITIVGDSEVNTCKICGKENCITTHVYCEVCEKYDCGITHNSPDITPVIPENPTLTEGADVSIVDAEGNAITAEKGFAILEGTRASLSAWSELEDNGNVTYQLQIRYDAEKDLWTDIQGQTAKGLVISPAMVNSITSPAIRCEMISGETVQHSAAIPVTVEAVVTQDANVAPAMFSLAKMANDVATVEETGTGTSTLKEYNIVINYVFGNNEIVAEPYTATLAAGSNFEATVNHPTVMGYLPYVGTDAETSTEIVLDITNIQADVTYTVTYKPTNVNYTVIHYKQNLDNDDYTEYEREILSGLTNSYVSTTVEGKYSNPELAKEYEGFYALLYEKPAIAADGLTVVEIYYDRNYYLVNFDMDGGYGTEPIYARYGAPLTAATPVKAGYTFLGWKLNGEGDTIAAKDMPTTMPAENRKYVAQWDANDTAKVTVVFWGETADCTDEAKEYDYYGSGTLEYNVGEDYTYGNETLACATEAHTHSNACIDCGKEEHAHTLEAGCYALNCSLTPHEHATAGCTLSCTKTVGHAHSKDCYDGAGDRSYNIILGGRDTEGYVYYSSTYRSSFIRINGDWYNYTGSVASGNIATPSCGEEAYHRHIDTCYTCGLTQSNHTHSVENGCYDLTCTKEVHSHNASCNGCGKVEHTHTEDCTVSVSNTFPSNLWTKVESETKTVLPDGTTAVNVYYDRTEFTLTYKYNYRYGTPQTTETIIAKWGANISDEYEKIAENANNTFWTENSNGEDGPFTNYFETMPQANKTYYCDGSNSGSDADMTYWGQDLNGEYTVKLFTVTNVGGYTVTIEDRYQFKGFTYSHGTDIGDNCGGAKFYYTRNSYTLDFNNGLEVTKSENVKYEAPLSTYAAYVPTAPNIYEEGSVKFAGWYLNPECTGEEFDLINHMMPAGNLILYAKWAPVSHTVKIYLTEEDSVADVNQLGTTQTVEHRATATAPAENLIKHPDSDDYDFVAWFYKDENGNEKAFDFSMPVTQDLVLYAKWSSNVLKEYTVYFKIQGTDIEIADRITGSTLAGETKTFDAKGGMELYVDYQEGYFPLVKSHSILIDINATEKNDTNVYTFWYVQKDAVPYTVYYVAETLKDGENPTDYKTIVRDGKNYYIIDDTYQNSKNRKAVVTETFKTVTGYMPDAYQKRLIVNGTDGAVNEIIFYYTVDTTHAYYKITHYTQNTDSTTWTEYASSQAVGNIGTTYTVTTPLKIDGFTYDSTVEGTVTSGELTAHGLELKLYYVRNKYPYEVRYLEQGTLIQLAEPKTREGLYGEVISEPVIDILNYVPVNPTSQTLTIRIEENDTPQLNIITFYYVEREVRINYVVVGPDGCGTVDVATDNKDPGRTAEETLKVLKGTAQGSTATANENYKFVGWYDNEACSGIALSTDVNYIPTKEENTVWVNGATYYAKFELAVADLTIEKVAGTNTIFDENDTFVFEVKDSQGNHVTEVVIKGTDSIIIKDLPIDTYTVTENTSWSYKYNLTHINGNAVDGTTSTEVTLTASGGEVTFTNTAKTEKWLKSDAYVENIFKDSTGQGSNANKSTGTN